MAPDKPSQPSWFCDVEGHVHPTPADVVFCRMQRDRWWIVFMMNVPGAPGVISTTPKIDGWVPHKDAEKVPELLLTASAAIKAHGAPILKLGKAMLAHGCGPVCPAHN